MPTDDPTQTRPSVKVGDTFSRPHRFTPDAVSAYASLMGDTNPLHHDAAVAARSRYGALIVSGTHTSALLLGLTASFFSADGSVVGVEFNIAFRRPVYADAVVTFEWTVTALRPHRGGTGQLVDMVGAVRDGDGQVCVAGTGTVLVGMDT